jgi:ABC-2 type transport system ATP-binding protein
MNALSISNLKKQYDNGVKALCGIDLEVKEGDFFALLGPNGAGKSTAIGIISSLVTKTSGEVKVFGYDVQKQPSLAKAQIGLVPQEFNFAVFEPLEEIIINQAGFYGIGRKDAKKRSDELLEMLALSDKKRTIPRKLSGGMKRRLMIARALVHKPKLLILDEPTAGVDIEIRRSMWSFLKEINEQGTTIILTTHYLEEAEQLCRNIAVINDGVIAESGRIKDLLARLNVEHFVLDTNCEFDQVPEVEGYDLTLGENGNIEVALDKSQTLNMLFCALHEKNIHINSMKNKTNRLEQVFMDLVTGSKK